MWEILILNFPDQSWKFKDLIFWNSSIEFNTSIIGKKTFNALKLPGPFKWKDYKTFVKIGQGFEKPKKNLLGTEYKKLYTITLK